MNHSTAGKRAARAAAALMVCVCALHAVGLGLGQRPAAEGVEAWVGEYIFEEDGGHTAGGSPIYVAHQLKVSREGGGLSATLESNGYQTYAAHVCEARAEGRSLKIFFVRHADENVFLRGEYRRGDLLLTLTRSGTGRRARLLTAFSKFRPQFSEPRRGRVYFQKSSQ